MEGVVEPACSRPVSGAPIKAYPSGLVPSRRVLSGRFIRLEPLDPAAHAEDLYVAGHGSDEALQIWDYLPHGPWPDHASFTAHLRNQAADLDMIRFVLRPASTGTASGMASYMDINARDGVIEIGGIWFSLTLQRSRAATSGASITGTSAAASLTNVDNTINGSGQLGNGALTLETSIAQLNPDTKTLAADGEGRPYAVLVVSYFFLVLHFLGGWLLQLEMGHRYTYAGVAILLIIGQAVVLESVTTLLFRILRGRSE